jgi:[ribosomal protein S5]-alanine N-acetyltransferase
MKSPTISSNNFILRAFKKDDAELFQLWDKDPIVQAHMPEYMDSYTDVENQHEYILECENDQEGWYWAIETNDGTTIGTISLTEHNHHHCIADLGIVIGDTQFWGKGVATEVIKTLVAYAFDQLHLSRINAEIESKNTPMARVLEKSGFTQDGKFVSARVKSGKRIDIFHFGITKAIHSPLLP